VKVRIGTGNSLQALTNADHYLYNQMVFFLQGMDGRRELSKFTFLQYFFVSSSSCIRKIFFTHGNERKEEDILLDQEVLIFFP
jgi:hypothetical protein